MPKYTHQKLHVFLKQDAKAIKSQQKQLKIADILNTLSTFLGYKNFHELLKRDHDKNTTPLVFIKYSALLSVLAQYKLSVENTFHVKYFFSKMKELKSITKIIYESENADAKSTRVIDFTNYNTGLSFDDHSYVGVMHLYISNKEKHDDDKDIWQSARIHFDLIIDTMLFFKVDQFQQNFLKWCHLLLLIEKHEAVTDRALNARLTSHFEGIGLYQKGEKHAAESHHYHFHFLVHLINHPYFNIEKCTTIHSLYDIRNDQYKTTTVLFHDYENNQSLFEYMLRNPDN
jgi:hypothetical protein